METIAEPFTSSHESNPNFANSKINHDIFLSVIKSIDSTDIISVIFLIINKNEHAAQAASILHAVKQKNDWFTACKNFIVDQENWQQKILEALILIQNFDVIRLMGYSFNEIEAMKIKFFYNVHNKSININTVIKRLYFLCEDLNSSQTKQLIDKMNSSLKINLHPEVGNEVLELEIYLLHLIQKNFISINSDNYNLKNLLEILQLMNLNNLIFESELKTNYFYITNDNSRLKFKKSSNDENLPQEYTCKSKNVDIIKSQSMCWEEKIKYCFIFNQITFTKEYTERLGSEKDAENLQTTFENCGFLVEQYNDLTTDEMIDILNTLHSPSFQNCGCIFICILSHGIKDEIVFQDSKTLSTKTIRKKFCIENLQNVFKFLIVQACRGNKYGLINSQLEIDGPTCENEKIDSPLNHQHFGIFYSTIPDFIAMRNETEGTWFIQEICNVIRNYSPITVLSMMQKVNEQMRQKRGKIKGVDIAQLSCNENTISDDFTIPKYNLQN